MKRNTRAFTYERIEKSCDRTTRGGNIYSQVAANVKVETTAAVMFLSVSLAIIRRIPSDSACPLVVQVFLSISVTPNDNGQCFLSSKCTPGSRRDRCARYVARKTITLKIWAPPSTLRLNAPGLIRGCSKSVHSPRTRKSSLTASEYCNLIHSDASHFTSFAYPACCVLGLQPTLRTNGFISATQKLG